MSHDGNRLKRWRESLPRDRGAALSRRAFGVAIGWSDNRVRRLEAEGAWNPVQREEVAIGVRGIAERMELQPAEVEACVRHVVAGAPGPKPTAWRPGMSPILRAGRPRSRSAAQQRISPAAGAEPERIVLRLLTGGKIDESTAVAALAEFYGRGPGNKSMLVLFQPDTAA